MGSFNSDPEIEISDGELEEAVGYDVEYFTQVPELFSISYEDLGRI